MKSKRQLAEAFTSCNWIFARGLFVILLLWSCSTTPIHENWVEFEGRLPGVKVYRAIIPSGWKITAPSSQAYLTDTTLPIFTCIVPCSGFQDIQITVHNFPTQSIEESIPSQMQISRWQNQFSKLEETSLNYAKIAYNGFIGYLFEASGILLGKPTSVLAVAMQIIPEHYRLLENNPRKEKEYRQMRADYTIKAVGEPLAIETKKDEILLFAESFELIDDIALRPHA